MQLQELLNNVKTKKYTREDFLENETIAHYIVTIGEEVHYLAKYNTNAWGFTTKDGDEYGFATTKKEAIKNMVIDIWAEKYQG